MTRILGLGDNTIDVYLDEALGFPGGNAVNVSVFCRRLGAEAAYVGAIGTDERGACLTAALKREAVDVSRCQTVEGPNAWACVEHRDGDRHFLGSDAGVCKRLELSLSTRAFMRDFDLVHTSAYSGMDTHLDALRDVCAVLTYDLSDDWTEEQLRQVCPRVDIVFLSASDRSGEDCRALARQCLEHGARHVVITRGEQGALACVAGEFVLQEAIRTEVRDTMGAGDGFIAAYLMAWLSGQPGGQCLLEGATYAARVCRHAGGFGHAFPISTTFHHELNHRFRLNDRA